MLVYMYMYILSLNFECDSDVERIDLLWAMTMLMKIIPQLFKLHILNDMAYVS